MKKIYLLMAVAAIFMVGCKNNGSKKAKAAAAAAEEVAQQRVAAMDEAVAALETEAVADTRAAVEKLSAADMTGVVETADEMLKKNADAAIPFAIVENKPGFNGGDANDFSNWVNEHIKYPQDAIDQHIEGRVVLQFIVSKTGSVENVEVIKGVNELLDQEAVRVVKESPKWEPGTINGIPVNVKYTFPVYYKIH